LSKVAAGATVFITSDTCHSESNMRSGPKVLKKGRKLDLACDLIHIAGCQEDGFSYGGATYMGLDCGQTTRAIRMAMDVCEDEASANEIYAKALTFMPNNPMCPQNLVLETEGSPDMDAPLFAK